MMRTSPSFTINPSPSWRTMKMKLVFLIMGGMMAVTAAENNNNNNVDNIYAAIGYGIPHDHSGHQSFTQQTIPEAHIPTSVEGCQVTCEGFYNNNILKGYSFYSPTTNTDGDGPCLWVLRKQRVPTNAPAMELVALMKCALAILDGAQAEMLEEIVPSDSVLTN